MRKILAGLLATSMIVSMSTMMTAATYTSASFTATIDGTGVDVTAPTSTTNWATGDALTGGWEAKVTVKSAEVVLAGGPTFSVAIDTSTTMKESTKSPTDGSAIEMNDITIDDDTLAPVLDRKSYPFQVSISGATYTGVMTFDKKVAAVKFDQQVKLPASITGVTSVSLTTEVSDVRCTVVHKNAPIANVTLPTLANPYTVATAISNWNAGAGNELIENDKTGVFTNLRVSDVIKSYGDGTPIPLTENKVGAGEDLNTEGGVQSGKTLYFMIRDDVVPKLSDDSYWKLKITKGDNGKYIDSVSDVTKIFNKDLYNANTGEIELGTGADKGRHRYIKVALKEIYTDDEYKINLDMTLRAQSPAIRAGIATDDSEFKIKDFSFYLKNIVKSADSDWEVGVKGLMLNPMVNDWNNVTYFDEENDVAFVRFFGDSDIKAFYAKLSTKWTHDDYAAYFNDQDAYYFEFTGSPKLSSTSRADLQIYNPFTDVDGNETIDPSTATIYQIVDGDLVDVTSSFTYGEGDNGENAFITRTRFLGSYIICEKPVDEAVGEENIDDLMPGEEEIPVAPETPDNNAGGKNPANTGRYN